MPFIIRQFERHRNWRGLRSFARRDSGPQRLDGHRAHVCHGNPGFHSHISSNLRCVNGSRISIHMQFEVQERPHCTVDPTVIAKLSEHRAFIESEIGNRDDKGYFSFTSYRHRVNTHVFEYAFLLSHSQIFHDAVKPQRHYVLPSPVTQSSDGINWVKM